MSALKQSVDISQDEEFYNFFCEDFNREVNTDNYPLQTMEELETIHIEGEL